MFRLCFALFMTLWLPHEVAARPYILPDTQVLTLHSRQTGADYELFIATPPDYRTSGKTFPVVYMLDADYAFALVRNIVQHFVERGNLPPMILVAVAYPGAAGNRETYRMNRTRDYTPVYAPDGGYGAEYQKVSGGGAKFRAFFASELIPFIDRKFPAAKGERALIGHSYGGLFATFVLLTEPALFNRYIIVSPSLWYANRTAMTMAGKLANDGQRPGARVFFAVGSNENQPQNGRPMVDDLKELIERLKQLNLPRLVISSRIYPGETHNSVFPGAVTGGLLTVFDRPPDTATPQSAHVQ